MLLGETGSYTASAPPKRPDADQLRIVTRPDFDGLVCAVLIRDAENITTPVKWVEPGWMQKGSVTIRSGDIIANLPYDPACFLWFDHHFSNRIEKPVPGLFGIAPSAAGLVYAYYKDRLRGDYAELVAQADKIDAADLSKEEVLSPEKNPYLLLSMTMGGVGREEDAPYWDRLAALFTAHPSHVTAVITDTVVAQRCRRVLADNRAFKNILHAHTHLTGHVSVTDFRDLDPPPSGNRFLVYCLFPQAKVSVKLRRDIKEARRMILSAGHSIFNPGCRVNIGKMLSQYGGGGHRGAGGCTVDADRADEILAAIVRVLSENQKND